MSYTRKQRAEAAARGWNKRREKHLQQPEYVKINLPKEPNGAGLIDIGAELPITTNALAGGIPKWEDPVLDLDASAYVTMRRCGAIKKATRKLGIRTVKLNWTVVGAKKPKPKPAMPKPDPLAAAAGLKPVALIGKNKVRLKLPEGSAIEFNEDGSDADPETPEEPNKQTRAEAVAEIFGQIPGWSDFVDWCTGSIHEGTRFYQIKTGDGREKAGGEAWKVPNLAKGGRHRVNAGGDLEWDGAQKLVQQQTVTGQADRPAKELPLDQFCIHSPGGSSNPNGDLDLGVALFNAVVKPWNRGITSGDLWVRLFAVPAILAGTKIDKARPDRITTMLDARAQALAASLGTQGNTTALSNDELIRLLQADPAGLTGMVAWQQYLEGIADDMITLGALTGSAGVAQANRTGDTETHRDNEDEAAFANAVQIAETFNRHILPWIIKKNPSLPPLEDGESEVYLWPNDPSEGDEQDVDVETEGTEDAPELDEADDVERTAALFADMQARSMTARGRQAQVALAAVSPTPPVH